MKSISQTHLYLVPLERSWKSKNSFSINHFSIINSDKVKVFQIFRNYSQSGGAAIIWDAAIKREITVVQKYMYTVTMVKFASVEISFRLW